MLVYFDSAQIAWLEAASEQVREALREVCRLRNVELVLSLEHLIEIGQLASDGNAAARARLLEFFPHIRTSGRSSADVVNWEIQQQLKGALGARPDSEPAFREWLFPHSSFRNVEATAAANFAVFQYMRGAFEGAAEAERLRKAASSPIAARLRLPQQIPANLIAAVKRFVARDLGADEATAAMMSTMIDQVAPQLGGRTLREGLISVLGLSDLLAVQRAPDEDLAPIAAYYSDAKDIAARLLPDSASTSEATALGRSFDPYECRGVRLRLAIHRARQRHPRPPAAGDQLDEDHVVFAPYVDVMFVDKRTHTHLVQEAKRSHGLLPLTDVAHIHKPRSLEDVTRIIDTQAAVTLKAT